MASQDQLFWATGIDNSGLSADKEKALQIFKQLSSGVMAELQKIENQYAQLKEKSNFKFTNPVDSGTFESVRKQIADLGKVIDSEIGKLSNLAYQYDKAMNKIKTSASKIPSVPESNPLASTVRNIHNSVQQADNEMGYLERIFKRGVSYMLVYGSIDWARNFAVNVVKTKGEFDQLRAGIDAFVNNAEKSKELFNDITSFAVRSPFQLLDITKSSKELLSYGVNAKNVMGTLEMLSNIASGSGQRIEDLTYLYGTSMTRGRVYQRELYQFATRGIPIYQALSKELGVNNEQLLKMVKSGQVGFPQLEKALQSMSAAGGRYYGMSDKIAQTTYGKLSNLEDKWKVALDQIGDANEGIMNSGIEMTSSLIGNWQKVADTIKEVIVVAGAYKASQIAVSAMSKGSEVAYAGAYTKSAVSVVSPEWKEQASKAELIEGSVAYQRELEKELALELRKSSIAVAGAEAEITRNTELIAEKEILIADSQKNVAAKELEVEASVANGSATEVETAQVSLNSAQKELNTLETDKNTAAESLNKAQLELSSAKQTENTIATTMNTAVEEGNTAAKGAGAIATGVLGNAWMKLSAFMKANEFALIAAAIAGVIYVLYKCSQAVDDATKAQQEYDKTINKIKDDQQKQTSAASDLINTMEQETSSINMKQNALSQLQKLMPQVFGNMKLETALNKDGLYWQKQVASQALYNADIQTRIAYFQAQRQVITTKSNLNDAKSSLEISNKNTQSYNPGMEAVVIKLESDLKIAQDYANKMSKMVLEINSNMRKASSAEANMPKNEDYWKKQVAYWQQKRSVIPSSSSGSTEWNHDLEMERKAQEELDKYEKSSQLDRKAKSAQTKAEREREQKNAFDSGVKTRKEQIRSNNKEITDYEAQAEQMRQEAYADSMDKGYIHDKQVIENEYNKKINDIDNEKDKILKLSQQNEKSEYLNTPVKQRGTYNPKIQTWNDVPEASKVGVNDATQAANDVRLAKEHQLQNELLRSYNDYTQQKQEIDRKYYADKQALEDVRSQYKEGSPEYGSMTSRIAQNEKERVLDQSNLSFKQVKETPTYQLAFDDLNKVSTQGLWNLMDMLKEYRKVAVEAYNPEDIKTYTEEINKVFDKLSKKDPFTVISKGNKDLVKAKQELKQSEDELVKAKKEYDDILAESITTPTLSYTPEEISTPKIKGKTKLSSTKDNTSTSTDKTTAAYNKLTAAQNKNAISGSKVVAIHKEIDTAEKTLTGALGDLGKSITSVGDSIGGVTGGIISLVGSISTTVTTAITGMDTASKAGSSTISTIEKASIILSVITTAIQLAEKVASLFSKESNFQKLEKQLTSLNKTLEGTVSLYKTLLETESGSASLTTGAAEIASIKEEVENYQALAKAKMEDSGTGHHSIEYKYGTISDIKATLAEGYSTSDLAQNNQDLLTFYNTLKDTYGISIDNITDLSTLTGEQLETLKTEDPEAWSRLDSTVTGYFDEIISDANSLQDTLNEIYASATGVDWSDLKDGLDDLLLSADTTMSDISDNFETYMRKAILNLVKTNYLSSALETWYTEFATDLNDDTLSADEAATLKDEYENIYTTASDKIDALLALADVSKTDTSSNTITSSFQSMSEDQADVLSAQFSAIRLNVSDILVSLKDNNNKIDLIASDISAIKGYTALIADIKSVVSDMYSKGVIAR